MDTEVLTVATHEEGYFNELINNKFNIDVKVLGFGRKWTGFTMKLELIYNYIKTLPDYKIIIFIDGFDSLINGTLNEAVNRFRNKNSKILFSKDIYPHSFFAQKIFPKCKDNIIVNSGLYMGYVKYLKILLSAVLQQKCLHYN